MSIKTNQKGFSAVEALLIALLVVIVGFVGWYVGHANQTTNQTLDAANRATDTSEPVNKKASSTTPPAAPLSKETEEPLIVAAVKAKNPDFPNISVTVSEIKDNFARGTAGSAEDGGFAYIAKKENNAWSVVFEGQQTPTKADGKKYGLPAGWYSTDL